MSREMLSQQKHHLQKEKCEVNLSGTKILYSFTDS